jgi:hypothetical protein
LRSSIASQKYHVSERHEVIETHVVAWLDGSESNEEARQLVIEDRHHFLDLLVIFTVMSTNSVEVATNASVSDSAFLRFARRRVQHPDLLATGILAPSTQV